MEIRVLDKITVEKYTNSFLEIIHQKPDEFWQVEHLLSDLPDKWKYSIAAFDHEKLVGFIIASNKNSSVHIHKFFVDQNHRNSGIGVRLLLFFERLLKHNFYKVISLKVDANNKAAINFYEKNGFKINLLIENNNKGLLSMIKQLDIIVAIHQPNYIPWIGFFYKMLQSDIFVLLDNVQHSKSSITHRNNIKTTSGEFLLSIPLKNKESIINELIIDQPEKCLKKHLNVIEMNYKKAQYYSFLSEELSVLYSNNYEKLIDLNVNAIELIKDKLDINTKLVIASHLSDISGIGSDRNLSICKSLNASVYISGKGAKTYNDTDSFDKENIKLEYSNFNHPIYPQLWGDFIKGVSAIDLLLNCGFESKNILRESFVRV